MAMYSLTNFEKAGIGARLKNGGVSVGVTVGGGRRRAHTRVEQESFKGEIVADKPNDDGVPKNSGSWFRQRVEHLACNEGLAFSAKLA